MKKIVGFLATLALVCTMLGFTAGNASAHTPSVTASCSGVVLKGTNYDGNRANKWSVTINGVTQSGTFGSTLNKTFPVPQDVVVNWSGTVQAYDGRYKQTNNGTFGPCDTSKEKITLCHATGSNTNPYTAITVDKAAFYKSGHISHAGDIYPAGSYVQNGKTFSWKAQGDQRWLPNCVRPDKPEPLIEETVNSRSDCTGYWEKTTTTTTDWVFDTNRWAWVQADVVVHEGDWVFKRALTDAEKSAKGCVKRTIVPPVCDVCHLPVKAGSKGNVVCSGAIVGGVYNNITVKRGKTCVLVDVYVNGSVKAKGARNLLIHDATVRGNIVAQRVSGDVYFGSAKSCAYDPQVGGSIIVKRSHNVLICKATVCKDIVVKRNNGKITVANSSARRVVIQGNKRYTQDGREKHGAVATIRVRNVHGHVVARGNSPRKVLTQR